MSIAYDLRRNRADQPAADESFSGEYLQALRLDPIDGEGDFTFSHAQIVDFRGKVMRTFSPADFRAAHDIARMDVYGDTIYMVTKPGARDVVIEFDLREPIRLIADGMARFDDKFNLIFKRKNFAAFSFVCGLDLLLKIMYIHMIEK